MNLTLYNIPKVLFLDIDGVLNSNDNSLVQGFLWRIDKNNKSKDEFGRLFDERCVRWLNYIVLKTSCKIVLSSSWRSRLGLREVQLMWEVRDLPGEVIDCTPNEVSEETIQLYAEGKVCRGHEIQEWIDKYKPQKYCIIDDRDEMLSFQHFVITDPKYGLSKEEALAVEAILNESNDLEK